MIESKYVEGIAIPTFDKLVTQVLEDYSQEGGGKDMEIAIENSDGEIYRVLTATGLNAFMHVTGELSSLGFADKLADDFSGRSQFDCWFVPTQSVLSQMPSEPQSEVMKSPTADPVTDVLNELATLDSLTQTEREAVVLSRVGQGKFRDQLIAYWKKCAVTDAGCVALLKASHIKPWRDATTAERLDLFNGLLLAPNIDAAFDSGYVAFDHHGRVILSREIKGAFAYQLHINGKLRIDAKLLTDRHRAYLEYHRVNVFRG